MVASNGVGEYLRKWGADETCEQGDIKTRKQRQDELWKKRGFFWMLLESTGCRDLMFWSGLLGYGLGIVSAILTVLMLRVLGWL